MDLLCHCDLLSGRVWLVGVASIGTCRVTIGTCWVTMPWVTDGVVTGKVVVRGWVFEIGDIASAVDD